MKLECSQRELLQDWQVVLQVVKAGVALKITKLKKKKLETVCLVFRLVRLQPNLDHQHMVVLVFQQARGQVQQTIDLPILEQTTHGQRCL